MISRQQYLQALAHPDFYVRSGVLCMFSEDRDPGLDVTAAVLATIDRLGASEAFEFPHKIAHLAIDEIGVAWVIEKVASLGDTSAAFHFLQWVCKKAPVSILQQRIQEIEGAAAGKFEDFPRLIAPARQRIEYHNLPARECFSRLHDILERCEEGEEFPHALLNEARLLCGRLVEEGDAHAELKRLTQEWLGFDFGEKHTPRHWFSGMAIELAGMLGLQPTIPRLIEHFDYDWDWWNEAIQKSIRQMRTPGTLELCAALYPSLEWHGRLYLGDVFESPCIPEIEPTLSKLLEDEDSDDLRVNLAIALALLGTPSSQQKARAVYEECPEEPERFSIAETLYYQFVIQGIEEVKLEQWRAKMDRFRRMAADPSRLFSGFKSEPLDSSNIIPAKFKVGRNDPCPCGSGKKYKKCCMKP